MECETTKQVLHAPDGTVVLIYERILPCGLSEYRQKFYKSIADSFEKSANGNLLILATNAYSGCTDRRKRYRYTPTQAEFICQPSGEDEFLLRASFNGQYCINESHKWRGDVIKRRKKIKR